jgi:uncharacterized iron-regulated protein
MKIKYFINLALSTIIITLIVVIFLARESSSFHRVLRISDKKVITFNEMVEELKGIDIIFVGELHDNKKHHKAQLDIIREMEESGRPLSIALEMFKIEDQDELDGWIKGEIETKPFIQTYADFWGLPWSLYSNIFLFSREKRIPMVGLNVPKEITRKVLEHGFESLSSEELFILPPGITCDDMNEEYIDYIKMAYDEHEWENKDFTFFCEAQMIWDKSMAWYLLDYMNEKPGRTIVVLTGIGHSWKYGIPEKITKKSDYTFRVILPEIPDRANSKEITIQDADYLLLK